VNIHTTPLRPKMAKMRNESSFYKHSIITDIADCIYETTKEQAERRLTLLFFDQRDNLRQTTPGKPQNHIISRTKLLQKWLKTIVIRHRIQLFVQTTPVLLQEVVCNNSFAVTLVSLVKYPISDAENILSITRRGCR
jgi:hypothetical protein